MFIVIKNKKELSRLFAKKAIFGQIYPKKYPFVVKLTEHTGLLETYYTMSTAQFPKRVHRSSYFKGLKKGMAMR